MAEPAENPLPVIDFSPFYTRDPAALQTLIAQVRAACLDKGFFQLANHTVPPSLQSAMFEQAQKFFSLPMDEKLKIDKDLNTYYRGYEPFRSQAFYRSTRPDLKEGVDFGVDYPLTHPYVIGKRVACGPNLYPQGVEDPAAFRTTVDTYLRTVMALAANVLSVIALTLGLPEDHFDEFKNDPLATVKMLRYPSQDPAAADDEERGIGAHTDFGFVTLLLQDNVGGLQVFDHGAGSWLDVPPIPNAYVVNLGDCMRRATNDRYASGLHQVINKSGRERYSIAVFHAGQPDYLVRCLPGCADEDGEEGKAEKGKGKGEKHEPVTVNDYVTIRYDDSYGRAKELLAAA